MTKQRRVVWLSDEEWAELKRRAELRELSVSAYIGASIGGGFVGEVHHRDGNAQNNDIANLEARITKPNPYTEVHAVPKPGKGK